MDRLDSHPVMQYFLQLTEIPRPSGHTEKIRGFLLDFAASNGIEAFADEAGNVIMRKPASPGYENRKGVVLQAHMDMVPQKRADVPHNFLQDPIQTYIDGDWLKASGTTLGADNGVGVAAIMAIMVDRSLKHGPVEALITRDEETGMNGAFGLKGDELNGEILLNLDSEEEGELYIGCAGGVNIDASLIYKEIETETDDITFRVTLGGLHGGHSGMEISDGYANANKLMARFLREAVSLYEICLVSWSGGELHNAIPREATAVISVMPEMADEVKALVTDYGCMFTEEYEGIEKEIFFKVEEYSKALRQVPDEIRDNLIDAVLACRNGVIRYIPSIPEVVETSSNLAVVSIGDGRCTIQCFARSARDSMKDYIAACVESCFLMAGMKVQFSGEYSGWTPNMDSPILKEMIAIYERREGRKPEVKVIHAGLECGIFAEQYPEWDMISFGPTLCSPHTPDERLLLSTVPKFYGYLVEILENIPVK